MKVEIHDFQSIRHLAFEAQGLTVITGRSSIGKSAIIRAIASAFFGRPGDYFIRHGEDTTKVELEDQTLELRWQKTTDPKPHRQTELVVNGTRHTKLGRDHAKLTEETGVKALPAQNTDLYPQFAGQHDNNFLVNESETTTAEIFKLLSRVDTISTAQQMVVVDRRSKDQLKRFKETEHGKAKAEVERLDPVQKLVPRFRDLQTQVTNLQAKGENLEQARTLLARLESLRPVQVPKEPTLPTLPLPGTLAKLKRLTIVQPRPVPDLPKTKLPNPKKLDLLRRLVQTDRLLAETGAEQAVLLSQLEETKTRKHELEHELGVCPTCERSFQ